MAKLHIDDLKEGKAALVGYRAHQWRVVFMGWALRTENGRTDPVAKFRDEDDGMEWAAYLFEGKFCVGSSADQLKVYAVYAE